MNKKLAPFLIIIALCGCSIPRAITINELNSYNTKIETIGAGMGENRIYDVYSDFRGNEIYSEDVEKIKEDVEKYISLQPELSEESRNILRGLKVIPGMSKDEITLLLGAPDKTENAENVWIYRTNRMRAFTFFIMPVYLAHEGYYLTFKNNRLENISRHTFEQIVHQAVAPGLSQKSK